MPSNPSRDRPVGVLGLGAMELAMAGRLAQRFAVVGYDPNDARVVELEARGAAGAASPAEVAARCAAVVVVVRGRGATRGRAVRARWRGARARRSIQRDHYEHHRPRRCEVGRQPTWSAQVDTIDAPVSGGPGRAASGTFWCWSAADPVALARAQDVLNQLGSYVRLVGGAPGCGQTLKIVNQLLCGIHIVAAAEALAVSAGARTRRLGDSLGALSPTQGGAASFMLADRGPRMLAGTGEVHGTVDIFVKDMALVSELAADAGQPIVLGCRRRPSGVPPGQAARPRCRR